MSELKKTPLCERHQALGAKMVPFAGWLMPVSYSGIQAEHFAVREKAGLFDASHMGLVRVTGTGALAFLQNISVNDAGKLQIGQSQYSAMCYPSGTVVDDIYVSRTAEQEFHVTVNAGCKEKDLEWMRSHADASVCLELQGTGILAVQGPCAVSIVAEVFGAQVVAMVKNQVIWVEFAGQRMLLSRTGYTGEDGFEVFPPNDLLCVLMDKIIECGAPYGLIPCGLGCRDTLRLESGFSLYGHELNDTINLVEAGLSWIVGWSKANFIGKDALVLIKAKGASRKLVGLLALDKALPREGMIVSVADREVGVVTSGGLSPVLNKGIALAYVETAVAIVGQRLDIQIRDQVKSFQVASRRFVGGK